MERTLTEPARIVETTIFSITSSVTKTHPDTGNPTSRYFLHLSNNVTIELLQGDIYKSEGVPHAGAPVLQIVGGAPTVAGEKILAVVRRADRIPPQVAVVLSSGRAMMLISSCDGGNALHVESVEGVARHFGDKWVDFWSGSSTGCDLVSAPEVLELSPAK